MRGFLYLAGRAFQLTGLLAMPSAFWIGWLDHNEQGSILVFTGSIVVFFIGYLLTQVRRGL